jgi:hypothetical protein
MVYNLNQLQTNSAMKNKTCSLYFIGAILFALQHPASGQLSLGIKGGINITSVVTDLGYKKGGVGNTIGGHAGIMLDAPISDRFAIQPEINWLQKGYAINNGTVTTKWIFNIIDIHLLAKYKFDLGNVKSFIHAGPTFGPVLGGFRDPDNVDKNKLDLNADQIRKWDYGISTGLGFGLVMGSGTLFVDGHYMLSLSDIFVEEANKGKFQKVGFDYTLGYFFPLK